MSELNHSGNKTDNSVLAVRDFSSAAIKKVLKRNSFSHWSTKYSATAFLGSVAWAIAFGLSPAIFAAIVVSFGASCLSWVYNYFFQAGNFKMKYVEQLQLEIQKETERKRRHLAEELVDHDCQKGVEQLEQFQRDFDSLVELLGSKLDTQEVTYKRYYGMAQEVFLSGVDNLRKVLNSLMSISEIDVDEIKGRLAVLKRSLKDDLDARVEIDALNERLNIRKAKIEKVKALLLENEGAITGLERTAAAIADLDTGQDEGKIDMEQSMEDLMRIVNRAKKRLAVKDLET